MSALTSKVCVVVKLDVDATKKLLVESLAELEPTPHEDVEPDYEFMPAPWCDCHCHSH